LLLLLIMGVVQFALFEHATEVADAVAQQGLAVGRLQGETAAGGITEARQVLAQLGGSLLTDSNVQATRTGTEMTVTVTGRVESVIGIWSLPVRGVASGPTETYSEPGPAP
jgi:hypothetical protein